MNTTPEPPNVDNKLSEHPTQPQLLDLPGELLTKDEPLDAEPPLTPVTPTNPPESNDMFDQLQLSSLHADTQPLPSPELQMQEPSKQSPRSLSPLSTALSLDSNKLDSPKSSRRLRRCSAGINILNTGKGFLGGMLILIHKVY